MKASHRCIQFENQGGRVHKVLVKFWRGCENFGGGYTFLGFILHFYLQVLQKFWWDGQVLSPLCIYEAISLANGEDNLNNVIVQL